MNRLDRRLIIWLLLCGLAVGFFVIVAGDAAAVERPSDPGPYSVGYFDVELNITDEGRSWMYECRYYYPATSDGEGADPDPTGGPYPPIIYHVYLDMAPNPKYYNRTSDRERVEFVVSHGFVVLTFTPYKPVAEEGESFYNDLVYHTDMYDANVSSPLHGMIKKDAYGALGEMRGGSLSFVHAVETNRITAVCSLGPDFSLNYSEPDHGPGMAQWNARDGAWMVQKGENTVFKGNLLTQYEHVEPNKLMVTIPGGDQRGPFRLDLIVAFFHSYLGGEEDYKTYLYGDDATNEVYTGQYRLRYDVGDGEVRVFQPTFTIDVPSSVNMDGMVEFKVTCDSYVLLDHPTLVHEWYLGDEVEPDDPYITSTEDPNVMVTITEPGEYDYVRYKYKIGNFTVRSDVARIVVRNVWPVADAGLNRTVFQDRPFELDGSLSNDTLSDQDTLEYNWTFGGKQTPWSMDPTYPVDTSVTRKITATLTVRDRHGKMTMDSVTIDIVNKPPEAKVGADMTSLEDEGLELTGWGEDTVSDSIVCRWVFGDGARSQWSASNKTNHTYTQQDTYTVTFEVKDTKGALNSTTLSVTVSNVAPTAGIDLPGDGAKSDMDSKVEFTGWGRDTPSDNGSLWYTWDFDDGRTAEGADVSHTFKEAGRYTVTLTVEDNDGATVVVTHNLTIEEAGPPLDGPIVFTVTVGFLAMLVLGIVWATEPGKYWFGLLGAPLFTKTKDVLDNKTRHALLGVIVTNPGIHYTALKEEFDLANGAAAYHLDVLERESFIRSVRDGKLKRFYSAHTKVPEDVGRSPEDTRDAIVELVRATPGINQLEVMEELGLDRDAASYYLRELVKEDRLADEKEGKYTVYTVNRLT